MYTVITQYRIRYLCIYIFFSIYLLYMWQTKRENAIYPRCAGGIFHEASFKNLSVISLIISMLESLFSLIDMATLSCVLVYFCRMYALLTNIRAAEQKTSFLFFLLFFFSLCLLSPTLGRHCELRPRIAVFIHHSRYRYIDNIYIF